MPKVIEHHTGAVAVLVCELFGGRIPSGIAAPAAVDLRCGIGKSTGFQRCAEAQKADPGTVGEKTQKSIEHLANLGLSAETIAQALGEDITEVQRIMRKRGWNLELLQKISVLLRPSDLSNATNIDVEILVKNKPVATGTVSIQRILQSPTAKHSEVVQCHAKDRQVVELDLECRFYAFERNVSAPPSPVQSRSRDSKPVPVPALSPDGSAMI